MSLFVASIRCIQTLSDLRLPSTTAVPMGDVARTVVSFRTGKRAVSRRSIKSQKLTVASSLATARNSPFADTANPRLTSAKSRDAAIAFVFKFQMRTLRSLLPEASQAPSGLSATQSTRLKCPFKDIVSFHVLVSHTRIRWSAELVAKIGSVRENASEATQVVWFVSVAISAPVAG